MGSLICLDRKDDPESNQSAVCYVPSDWDNSEIGSPPPTQVKALLSFTLDQQRIAEETRTEYTSVDEKTSCDEWLVNPLELSANTPLERVERLLQLGRLYEAAALAQKLPPDLKNNPRVQFCLSQMRLVEERRRSLESLDGWRLQVDGSTRGSEGISIHYRCTPGSRVLELRSCFKIKADLLPVRALRGEIALWPMFLGKHITIETEECASRGWAEALGYMLTYMPWPLKKRECYLKFHMYDMIAEEGFCLWWGEDVVADEHCLGMTIPEVSRDIVRATGKVCAMERILGNEVIELTLVCQMDLQMVFPQWLVNFLTRKVGWHAAKQFKELCMDLPKEHQQKIAEDKTGIYGSLKERVDLCLALQETIPGNDLKSADNDLIDFNLISS